MGIGLDWVGRTAGRRCMGARGRWATSGCKPPPVAALPLYTPRLPGHYQPHPFPPATRLHLAGAPELLLGHVILTSSLPQPLLS